MKGPSGGFLFAPICGRPSYGVGGMKQAVKAAKEYLQTQAFSRSGLIHQLEFDGSRPLSRGTARSPSGSDRTAGRGSPADGRAAYRPSASRRTAWVEKPSWAATS